MQVFILDSSTDMYIDKRQDFPPMLQMSGTRKAAVKTHTKQHLYLRPLLDVLNLHSSDAQVCTPRTRNFMHVLDPPPLEYYPDWIGSNRVMSCVVVLDVSAPLSVRMLLSS